jgi:hypothetical protein
MTAVTKEQFANDGSYESVERMLRQLAGKCFKRVSGMGLSMDFDDCMGIMNVGYAESLRTWDPEKSKFATWCQFVGLQHFNRAIAKEERERAEMGMVSFTDIMGSSEEGSDDFTEFFAAAESDAEEAPDERRARFELNMERLRTLSPAAKRLVKALIESEMAVSREIVTLHSLTQALGMDPKTVSGVCRELKHVYSLTNLRVVAPARPKGEAQEQTAA